MKTKHYSGLDAAFQELITLDGTKPVKIEDVLTNHGVKNVQTLAVIIRRKFLTSQKRAHYAWDPKAKIPRNVRKFETESVQAYKENASEWYKTNARENYKVNTSVNKPVENQKRVKYIIDDKAIGRLQAVLNSLKEATDFKHLHLSETFCGLKIPYCGVMTTPVIRDFLEKGKKIGHYRWRDQNVPVPDAKQYYDVILEYSKSFEKNRGNNKRKPTDSENPGPIVSEVQAVINTHPRPKQSLQDEIDLLVRTRILSDFSESIKGLKAAAIEKAKGYNVILSNSDFFETMQ